MDKKKLLDNIPEGEWKWEKQPLTCKICLFIENDNIEIEIGFIDNVFGYRDKDSLKNWGEDQPEQSEKIATIICNTMNSMRLFRTLSSDISITTANTDNVGDFLKIGNKEIKVKKDGIHK